MCVYCVSMMCGGRWVCIWIWCVHEIRSFPSWVLEVELRSWGLQSKYSYSLSHLASTLTLIIGEMPWYSILVEVVLATTVFWASAFSTKELNTVIQSSIDRKWLRVKTVCVCVGGGSCSEAKLTCFHFLPQLLASSFSVRFHEFALFHCWDHWMLLRHSHLVFCWLGLVDVLCSVCTVLGWHRNEESFGWMFQQRGSLWPW